MIPVITLAERKYTILVRSRRPYDHNQIVNITEIKISIYGWNLLEGKIIRHLVC